jgi:DNA-directed RNA polymerase specialized sigma24 family protein
MTTMVTHSSVSDVELFDLNSDSTWKKLYPILESLARYFVYSSHVLSWQGQENDIIEDVVQETLRRMIEHAHKAERDEAPPIQSFKSMMKVVAQNYCKDMKRRDRRLLRMQPQDALPQLRASRHNQVSLVELGTENVYQEGLFKLVASEIAGFPEKQHTAVLIDLANRMHFGTQLTPLESAFLEVGIDLRQYQRPLPADPQERSRHLSLLTHAYRRIAGLPCVQQYIAFA